VALVAAIAAAPCSAVPMQLQPKHPGAAPSPPPPHVICTKCKAVVGEIQHEVAAANSTYGATLQEFFDTKICPSLPPDSQKACKDYVDTEVPALWDTIVNEILDPVEACKKLDLCSARAGAGGDEVGNIVECRICKQAAKFIDKKIFEDPEVDAKVGKTLATLCKAIPDMPKAAEAKCEAAVKNNTADLMEELGELIATELCKDTGLCKKSSALVGSALSEESHAAGDAAPSPAMCDKCKDVIGQMQAFMVDTNSSYNARVEDFIDKTLCPKMPVDFRKDCVNYVHKVMPEVWDALINEVLDPASSCAALGLCASKGESAAAAASILGKKKTDGMDCKVCKQATKMVALELFENAAVEKKVATELTKVCDHLPKSTPAAKAKCVTQITEDTPAVMKEMGEALRLRLCVDAKICKV